MSRNARNLIAILCAIALAVTLRVVDYLIVGLPHLLYFIGRPTIYITLYIVWGLSVRSRIVQPRVRHCLECIAAFAVLWWMLRTAKYNFAFAPSAIHRYLWYGYYIPMILIPQIALLAALLLRSPRKGSSKAVRSRVLATVLFTVSCVLILLVVTNDAHQLAFDFNGDLNAYEEDYRYGPVYYAAVAWMVFCAFAMIAVLASCVRRSAQDRQYWLLFLFPAIALGYTVLFVAGVPFVRQVLADITAVLCLVFVGCLESCIQCGLIKANSRHGELFDISSLGAQVVDREYRVRYRARNALKLRESTMRATEQGSVVLDGRVRVKGAPLAGGRVIWQEDVSDILGLIAQLEENRHEIAESVHVERELGQVRLAAQSVREKTRLYDLVQAQTSGQIAQLDEVIGRARLENDPLRHRALLAWAVALGSYIKRRGNLVLMAEAAPCADSGELQVSLEELFGDLRRMGTDCAAHIPLGYRVRVEDMLLALDGIWDAACSSPVGNYSPVGEAAAPRQLLVSGHVAAEGIVVRWEGDDHEQGMALLHVQGRGEGPSPAHESPAHAPSPHALPTASQGERAGEGA